MTTHLVRTRMTLPAPAAAFVRRGKLVLTAIALVAAVLLVAVGAWPLKVLVVLAFVRGFFASDVTAIRNARRSGRSARVRRAASFDASRLGGAVA